MRFPLLRSLTGQHTARVRSRREPLRQTACTSVHKSLVRKWRMNHPHDSRATSSSAPRSGKRWDACCTTSSSDCRLSDRSDWRLRSRTCRSAPPTTSSVGASTPPMLGAGEIGPPATRNDGAYAGRRLRRGNQGGGRAGVGAEVADGQRLERRLGRRPAPAAMSRPARSPISKRSAAVARSACSSAGVNRSSSRVANAAGIQRRRNERLRGLWRLLPAPWAKTIAPRARSGSASEPTIEIPSPASICTRQVRVCRACAMASGLPLRRWVGGPEGPGLQGYGGRFL